ncbi:tetratricopeptide repeat-containing sensor histidine kinase [Dyadobacter psychrotolerans]|uniref:histidine kinase n=1 Tax=Dyadobacter psychrotolerans TaxID=2541721 RepID=A0A4R5DRI3_9BACT|nr:ATP-binding protein [Dyadobacter psychrotolerans]TDE14840.1 hypothetical protein E0F88_16805 [Dyadobacter psychrotolerans]
MQSFVNKVRLLLAVLLLSSSSFLHVCGQSSRRDSLRSLLQTSKNQDTNKVILLNDLAYQSYSYSVKDFNTYSQQALLLSEKLSYRRGQAVAYKNMALFYMLIHGDVTSLKYLNASLSIFSSLKDSANIAGVVNYIGCFYASVKDYKKALPYFLRSETILGERQNPIRYTIWSNTGACYEDLKQYGKASLYYDRIKKHADKSKDYRWIVTSLYQTASLQMARQQFDQALSMGNQALGIIQSQNVSPREAQIIYMLMGDLAFKFKDYQQARKFYQLCESSLTKLGSREDLSLIFYKNHLLDSIAGNFQSALGNLKKYQLIKDSVINQNKNQIIALYDVKYEVDQNEAKTTRLIAEKNTDDKVIFYQRLIIGVALLGLFVIIFALLRLRKLNDKLQDLNYKIARQNTELEEANSVKTKIFSVIAHDLRSPFAEFVGILELTEHQLISQEEITGLLPSINRTVRSTMGMMDNLLIWSKKQMNGVQINPENIDLAGLVSDGIEKLQTQVSKKNLIVTTSHLEKTSGWADAEMIRIVIRNLLSNAVKFTAPQGSIRIESYNSDKEVILTIKDSGVGLSPVQLNQLFSLHIQSTKGTQNESGTGLGLTICRDLIELNNGSIRAESVLGQGSTFYVSLPLQKQL